MPEGCTPLKEIQSSRHKLGERLAAAGEGRVVPHEELKKRLSKWLAG